MTFSYRKTIKLCYTILCIITVSFMMGYWFYKYEVEDRDIGVVDYAQLENAKEIKIPDVTICIDFPFHVRNLKAINSTITIWDYIDYLRGDVYDKMYEEIDYSNVTMDLNKYFKSAWVSWRNGSSTPISSDSINYIETFNGFSNEYVFIKCFTMRSNVEEQRRVKQVEVNFDSGKMISDLSNDKCLSLFVHYPNQFFLLKSFESPVFCLKRVWITYLIIEKLEILKQRNSRHRKCSNDIDNYDGNIVNDVLHKTECHPPYIQSHQSYPKCKTQKDIKEGIVDILAQKRVRIPNACQRISEVRQNIENVGGNFTTWRLQITYPEEVKIITKSKDVDVHSLIGTLVAILDYF